MVLSSAARRTLANLSFEQNSYNRASLESFRRGETISTRRYHTVYRPYSLLIFWFESDGLIGPILLNSYMLGGDDPGIAVNLLHLGKADGIGARSRLCGLGPYLAPSRALAKREDSTEGTNGLPSQLL